MKTLKNKIICSALVTLILSCSLSSVVYGVTLAELDKQKETAHNIAEDARSIGLSENHPIILGAKSLWENANTRILNGEYEKPTVKYYTDNDALMLAKLMYGEGRGIKSETQLACICWTVLNRVDAGQGSISAVITAPNQFHYSSSFPTISDWGTDLKNLAYDVLERWNNEKNGLGSNGRVLPSTYMYYHGNGRENIFRDNYSFSKANFWNYSLFSPYTT